MITAMMLYGFTCPSCGTYSGSGLSNVGEYHKDTNSCSNCHYPAIFAIGNAKIALEHYLRNILGYHGPHPDWYVGMLNGMNVIMNPLLGIDERIAVLAREYNGD